MWTSKVLLSSSLAPFKITRVVWKPETPSNYSCDHINVQNREADLHDEPQKLMGGDNHGQHDHQKPPSVEGCPQISWSIALQWTVMIRAYRCIAGFKMHICLMSWYHSMSTPYDKLAIIDKWYRNFTMNSNPHELSISFFWEVYSNLWCRLESFRMMCG